MSRSDEGSDVASRTANWRSCSGLAKLAADEPRIVLRQLVGGKAGSIPSRQEFNFIRASTHVSPTPSIKKWKNFYARKL
jgi:hypothetical protein